MALDLAEREWLEMVAKIKKEEKKSIKEKLEAHLVKSGRAAEASTLAENATPEEKRKDEISREEKRQKAEVYLQNDVADRVEMGANVSFAANKVAGNLKNIRDLSVVADATNKLAEQRAAFALADAAVKSKKNALDVSDKTLRAAAEKVVVGKDKTLNDSGRDADKQKAIDDEARTILVARQDKAIGDRLKQDTALVEQLKKVDPTLSDATWQTAVDDHKLQVELDNVLNDEIATRIKNEVTATDPLSRNEKIEQIVIEVAEKYGETNLAHFIGRHGAQRENPATGTVTRTTDDMVGRLVAGVGADKKKATVLGGVNADETATLKTGGTVTVPGYKTVGSEAASTSSQHSSAKAALYMLDEAFAEAARLERQIGALAIAGGSAVKLDIGPEAVGNELLGNYGEKGKLGDSYTLPDALEVERGDTITPGDIKERIKHTSITRENQAAEGTLLQDKLHGGLAPMTFFSKSDPRTSGSQLMGEKKKVLDVRDDRGGRKSAFANAEKLAEDRLTKLTEPGGPKENAEQAATKAEAERANDDKEADTLVSKKFPGKKQAVEEAKVATNAAAAAEAQVAELKKVVDRANKLLPEAQKQQQKAEDAAEAAVKRAQAEAVDTEKEQQLAGTAYTSDKLNEAKKAAFAEAKLRHTQALANVKLAEAEQVRVTTKPTASEQATALAGKLTEQYKALELKAAELVKKREESFQAMAKGENSSDADEVKQQLLKLGKSTAAAGTAGAALGKVEELVASATLAKAEVGRQAAIAAVPVDVPSLAVETAVPGAADPVSETAIMAVADAATNALQDPANQIAKKACDRKKAGDKVPQIKTAITVDANKVAEKAALDAASKQTPPVPVTIAKAIAAKVAGKAIELAAARANTDSIQTNVEGELKNKTTDMIATAVPGGTDAATTAANEAVANAAASALQDPANKIAKKACDRKAAGDNVGQIKTAITSDANKVAEKAALEAASKQTPVVPVPTAKAIAAKVAGKAIDLAAVLADVKTSTYDFQANVESELTSKTKDMIAPGKNEGTTKAKELAEASVKAVSEAAVAAAADPANNVGKTAFNAKATGSTYGDMLAAAYAVAEPVAVARAKAVALTLTPPMTAAVAEAIGKKAAEKAAEAAANRTRAGEQASVEGVLSGRIGEFSQVSKSGPATTDKTLAAAIAKTATAVAKAVATAVADPAGKVGEAAFNSRAHGDPPTDIEAAAYTRAYALAEPVALTQGPLQTPAVSDADARKIADEVARKFAKRAAEEVAKGYTDTDIESGLSEKAVVDAIQSSSKTVGQSTAKRATEGALAGATAAVGQITDRFAMHPSASPKAVEAAADAAKAAAAPEAEKAAKNVTGDSPEAIRATAYRVAFAEAYKVALPAAQKQFDDTLKQEREAETKRLADELANAVQSTGGSDTKEAAKKRLEAVAAKQVQELEARKKLVEQDDSGNTYLAAAKEEKLAAEKAASESAERAKGAEEEVDRLKKRPGELQKKTEEAQLRASALEKDAQDAELALKNDPTSTTDPALEDARKRNQELENAPSPETAKLFETAESLGKEIEHLETTARQTEKEQQEAQRNASAAEQQAGGVTQELEKLGGATQHEQKLELLGKQSLESEAQIGRDNKALQDIARQLEENTKAANALKLQITKMQEETEPPTGKTESVVVHLPGDSGGEVETEPPTGKLESVQKELLTLTQAAEKLSLTRGELTQSIEKGNQAVAGFRKELETTRGNLEKVKELTGRLEGFQKSAREAHELADSLGRNAAKAKKDAEGKQTDKKLAGEKAEAARADEKQKAGKLLKEATQNHESAVESRKKDEERSQRAQEEFQAADKLAKDAAAEEEECKKTNQALVVQAEEQSKLAAKQSKKAAKIAKKRKAAAELIAVRHEERQKVAKADLTLAESEHEARVTVALAGSSTDTNDPAVKAKAKAAAKRDHMAAELASAEAVAALREAEFLAGSREKARDRLTDRLEAAKKKYADVVVKVQNKAKLEKHEQPTADRLEKLQESFDRAEKKFNEAKNAVDPAKLKVEDAKKAAELAKQAWEKLPT